MNRIYAPVAEIWRGQAWEYVDIARDSDDLSDIVRLIAMASTLERAARKLCLDADVNFSEIAPLVNAGKALSFERDLLPAQMQPTYTAPPEIPCPIASRQGDAAQPNIGAPVSTHESVAQHRGSNMPVWKLIAMLSRPGGTRD